MPDYFNITRQTFTLDHLARSCPRKFYYLLNINLDRRIRRVQTEDLKKRERENIQKKYIQHYAFSTNKEKRLYDTFSKKGSFYIS